MGLSMTQEVLLSFSRGNYACRCRREQKKAARVVLLVTAGEGCKSRRGLFSLCCRHTKLLLFPANVFLFSIIGGGGSFR